MIAFITPPANRVIFSLFGIDIMWYGVLIAVGIFLGVFVGGKMAERFGAWPGNRFLANRRNTLCSWRSFA
jgi:prolipoprotein diacylglyceryltransferase